MKRHAWFSLLVCINLLLAEAGSAAALDKPLIQKPVAAYSPATLTIFNGTTNSDSIDGSCSPTTCSLRDAVTAADAISGAQINVPNNTYALTHGPLNVTSSMTISGTSTAGTIVDGGRSDRVFNVSLGVVTIFGMTIQHGYSPGVGGGIVDSGSLTLDRVKLFDNFAANSGGGAVAWTNGGSGTLTLVDSTVISNTASGFGGGLSSYDKPNWLVIRNSTIISNVAGTGAGIDSVSPITITQSSLSDNFSSGAAGGLRSLDGGEIISSTVSGNQSHNIAGGLFLSGPSIATPVTFTVKASTIELNSDKYVGGYGGGIDVGASNVTVFLINTTISGNTAVSNGGGVIDYAGQLELYNTTVTNNSAATGGGILVLNGTSTVTHLMNSLIGGNHAGTAGPDCAGTLNSEGYNLIQSTAGCSFVPFTGDITGPDPRLGPLQNNGGPTLTHALLINSPAIDAGRVGGCLDNHSLPITTDQRGRPRPFDGTRCDVGSYEYQSSLSYAMYIPLVDK